jgi:putative SOS response-associated peptidase YedK
MCYYNGQKVTHAEFIRLKQLEKALANYDFLQADLQIGFDFGTNAVLKKVTGQEDFDIVKMEWGFLPGYIKDREQALRMRKGYKDEKGVFHPPILTLNAIGEELLLPGKIYKDAALNRRCLVLSSGFYEWRHIFPTNKRTGEPVKTAIKYPYHIGLKGQEYFYMAGILNPWTDRQTVEHLETFAIVTTRANKLMEQIHNSKKRMPTILNEDLAYEWLLGHPDEKRITEIATSQYPAEKMEACTIAKDFITVSDPTQPFEYAGLPALEFDPSGN